MFDRYRRFSKIPVHFRKILYRETRVSIPDLFRPSESRTMSKYRESRKAKIFWQTHNLIRDWLHLTYPKMDWDVSHSRVYLDGFFFNSTQIGDILIGEDTWQLKHKHACSLLLFSSMCIRVLDKFYMAMVVLFQAIDRATKIVGHFI